MHAPPETERSAALGEREWAGQKEGRLSVSNHSASGKTDRLSADEWRMLINMRFGNLRKLAAHRARQGTLTEAHADLIRKEMTWARIHRGDMPETVMRWLTGSWPMYPFARLAAMTPEGRYSARKKQDAAFCSLIKWARNRKGWLRPLTIGNRLDVTPEERDLLKLRTIRYAGQTDEIMKAEQRERDRKRKAAGRRAEGKPTRDEWLAKSKPYVREGISKSGWYKRQKKAKNTATEKSGLVVPGYKSSTPSCLLIAEQPVHHVMPGRGLDAAPGHIPERIGLNSDLQSRDSGSAAAFLPSRGGWMAQPVHLRARGRISATATKITGIAEAQRGPLTTVQGRGASRPRPTLSDDPRPMGMARVLLGAQLAGASHRQMSAYNIFLQGGTYA